MSIYQDITLISLVFLVRYDLDKNGSIEARELKAIMSALGDSKSDSEIKEAISEVDKDQNGRYESIALIIFLL